MSHSPEESDRLTSEAGDDQRADQIAHYGKLSRRCAYGLYWVTACWGAAQLIFPDNGSLYLVTALLIATLVTGWAVFDAKKRGVQILPVVQMLYFFLWPIGAVIYLLYRSGIRGLLTAIVHGIGLTMTLMVSFYVTAFCLHWAGMLDERYYQ